MTKDSVDLMGLLDELLGTKKKAPKQDPHYGKFRRFAKNTALPTRSIAMTLHRFYMRQRRDGNVLSQPS